MPTWLLDAYELVARTGTLRLTYSRDADGDSIVKHLDIPQPQGESWTDADVCEALEAHLPVGHVVMMRPVDAPPAVDGEPEL